MSWDSRANKINKREGHKNLSKPFKKKHSKDPKRLEKTKIRLAKRDKYFYIDNVENDNGD